jgi:ABC-type polysaccharide/polyol phosphate export permease
VLQAVGYFSSISGLFDPSTFASPPFGRVFMLQAAPQFGSNISGGSVAKATYSHFMFHLDRLVAFVFKLYRYRGVIWVMAKHDLAARYVGTIGGPFWAIFHPLATVVVYWAVFSLGFKATGPSGMPFVVYFVCGLVPWLLFNNTIIANVSAVTARPHLVKKIVFPTEVLPIVNLVSEAFTHVAMLVILLGVISYYGYKPSPYFLQTAYYFFALCFFVVGLSWILSSLQVFHRDIGQGMTMLLNFWFWLTPIVWTNEMVPEEYRWALQLNPVAYVVEGYRQSLLHQQAAWTNLNAGVCYWLTAAVVLIVGAYVFRRLKPEFADVL